MPIGSPSTSDARPSKVATVSPAFSVSPSVMVVRTGVPSPSTGASLTGTSVTVEAMDSATVSTPPLATPPASCRLVSVTTRAAAVLGLSLVFS